MSCSETPSPLAKSFLRRRGRLAAINAGKSTVTKAVKPEFLAQQRKEICKTNHEMECGLMKPNHYRFSSANSLCTREFFSQTILSAHKPLRHKNNAGLKRRSDGAPYQKNTQNPIYDTGQKAKKNAFMPGFCGKYQCTE
jgi:hypothetical protein